MEEEQELLSDLAGYHDAEQLSALNITKASHVKKLLKQAKKQREKLGLPERAEEDTQQNQGQQQVAEEAGSRPDNVPSDAVNIIEDIQRRQAEAEAQQKQTDDTDRQSDSGEKQSEQTGPDDHEKTCKESSDYAQRQQELEEKTHRSTALFVEAERMRTVSKMAQHAAFGLFAALFWLTNQLNTGAIGFHWR